MVLMVVCCIFYLSHRNLRKRTNSNRRRWLDSDANMEIYSVEQVFLYNTMTLTLLFDYINTNH